MGLAQDSRGERVNDLDSGLFEIGTIACGDDQAMDEGRGRNQTILDRHGAARRTKTGEQLGPAQARLRLPRETMEPPNPRRGTRPSGNLPAIELFPLALALVCGDGQTATE